MEKINIAELLKNCPKDMELDCTICEDLYFDYVSELNIIHCYIQYETYRIFITFNQYGAINIDIKAKCVIFPKGKTTWEGFVPPCKFKDGDVIFVTDNDEGCVDFQHEYVAIFKEIKMNKELFVHGFYSYNDDIFSTHPYLCEITNFTRIEFANEEQKEKLFNLIKINGYKWSNKTKTFDDLVKPKFKVGDKIRHKNDKTIIKTINHIYYDNYALCDNTSLLFKDQDDWELAPNKFDITTLKPFDKVLVRTKTFTPVWTIDFYDGYQPNIGGGFTPFGVTGGNYFQQCIPYEGNEHLRGTTNECDEHFKNWE